MHNLTPEEIATLIAYARRKFREERFPFAPELREVREANRQARPEIGS